ncbi:MAG: DNA polymerase IV [Candidatus Iainarchaeum archaeon]|uniref:DNA polymerase IV n=1 Tax=Candidatus Iainarchaeum sp. TaxID=3101447 RepID=A0A7T9DJ67_9ARCH|nr:MAG: DNA polymerase IV [Candidatus Diapherotrites archaeon]
MVQAIVFPQEEDAMPRIVAHVDMNAFFAAIEQNAHPEWKNEPIVVCVFSGRTLDSGVVSSASYDARKLGVRAGMPIVQAKQLCAKGHFVPVNHTLYGQISDQIFTRLFAYGDAVEMASIDEAYADLTQKTQGDYAHAERLMREFQQKIQKEFNLGCSVGIAPNKLLAKIASDFQKPNGFTIVKPESVQSFLDPLPVKSLLGIGPKTEQQLVEKNIHTIAQLRACGAGELVALFGAARGQYFFHASRGIDESPLETNYEKQQRSSIWTLQRDTQDWNELRALVREKALELWDETAAQGKFFTQISVVGVDIALKQMTRSTTLNVACVSSEQLFSEVEQLFQSLLSNAPLPLRRVGLRVGGFASPPKQKRLNEFFG